MTRIAVFLLASLCAGAATPKKPKLVVAIVVDQFRYDYLTRYRADYTGGLNRLLTQGAVFANANYAHVPTITAVGHSTVLTGATPSISGIVANDWYDRDEAAHVTSVNDTNTKLLGGSGIGSSPHRLLVSTIGDELKMADQGKSRVIGISLKDRAAILPSGHMANGAFWLDVQSGNFVSSTYYYKDLPPWAKEFNAGHPADRYRGAKWLDHTLPVEGARLYTDLEATPFGNELIEAFAERALAGEQLGMHDVTDLLTISYSSNDYVGHNFGPDSAEARETALVTDRLLGRLFEAVERQVGAGNFLVVFTADHGASPAPAANAARKMPGGLIDPKVLRATVQTALVRKYGEGEWVAGAWDLAIYLNRDLAAQKKLDLGEVERTAADAVQALPHIFRVYTWQQMMQGGGLSDSITQKVANGFHLRRGPDVELIPDPYWMVRTGAATGTTHATPFSYDTHVPVIFMGAGIRPGRYNASILVNDIAPTLATMLDIETPSGSMGRVLIEILVD